MPPSELLRCEGLPRFDAIEAEHVDQQIPALLADLSERFTTLEDQLRERLSEPDSTPLSWDELMPPFHALGERLRWSWGVVTHLTAVRNTPELREAHARQQPEVVRFSNRVGQSRVLHQALRSLLEQKNNTLDSTQVRILETELLSMQHRGVGLKGDEQQAFNRTSERLAALSTSFSNHVLDATQQWSLVVDDRDQLRGVPDRVLDNLAVDAATADGPWRLGLDMPSYVPILTHAENRDLRETVYKAYVSRASQGELDNGPLIEEILALRQEQSQRLGYANWAELSLASKMADGVDAVETLLEELRAAALPVAEQELKELNQLAASRGAKEALAAWDVSFWAEQLRRERFDLDQEALRPWFPLPQVLDGLFNLCERLFAIRIEAADGDAPIWHEDVRFFRVLDRRGEALAGFYLDPFSRPASKRGGAWMDECLNRRRQPNGDLTLPVAYLICNQTPPSGETPSLMSFEEVETLFHEFGHGLQHMLTTVEHPQAAGINNVEWDAVELPSQFMENWCFDRKTLMGMARHWTTGEPLPEADYIKLCSSRTFMQGSGTLRQIHFALTDLRLHSQWSPELGLSPDAFRRRIAETTTVLPPIETDRFLCAFGHIFAGGYAAGYYSYKWAEVLSADAFSAFEEVGLEQDDAVAATGERFRNTILSLGGSLRPAEIYRQFRGRDASSAALIRHSGLATSTG
ncbi:oligopeptidase A [Synechococcus sp. MEDNS5]|uniref:M3 family metallopeptidase n=1 Tax=Synechococcus sp. MEDNS5 TaxID=1442554 RepID=UPI00164878A3|nr:M3 family metallopeptidase [Synechococcus sp. MEDNS5]QNJ05554.1 oligopeptidase A [Synechococcus sp. MEDNS5]